MDYKVELTSYFKKRAKRLIKKFPSLKKELFELGKKLSNKPRSGNSLGNNCYKIRLAIASKNKGKSSGARVITHIYVEQNIVYLLYIYDKSEQNTITDKEIKELINNLGK